MQVFVFLTVLSCGYASGFLLQDAKNNQTIGTNSNTDMTVQYLLGLMVDEKNSRHQLENIVTLMGNKIDELENKLTKTNTKVSQLEQYHTEVSRELQKERNNRQNLEHLNMVLEERIENMTNEYEQLKVEVAETYKRVTNMSFFAERLNNLSDCCESTRGNITNIETKLASLSNDEKTLYNLTRDVEKLYGNLKNVTDAKFKLTDKELVKLTKNMSLSNHGDKLVGFSVKYPNESAGGHLKFGQTIFDSGDGYNASTGMYTCRYPGLYFLTATLIKAGTISECSCYMSVNGKHVIRVFANTYGANNAYASSSSAFVYKLSHGDTVYLAECNSLSDFYISDTSFSGFLIAEET